MYHADSIIRSKNPMQQKKRIYSLMIFTPMFICESYVQIMSNEHLIYAFLEISIQITICDIKQGDRKL